MSYGLKLELTGRQAGLLHALTAVPLTRTVERHPDVMPALHRLRDALSAYRLAGLPNDPYPRGGYTVKLELSPHDEAVLALVLVDALADQVEQHRTITHPWVADVLGIQSELAGYVQARESAKTSPR